MMRWSISRALATLALVLAMALAPPGSARSADWPAKPVRIIVPYAAGGAADTAGRLYAEALSTAFGKQFIVENRTGGGGLPAAEAVARAEPDGYTLLVSGIPILVLAPAMNKNVGYDPLRDLTQIAYFGGAPSVLVVHPQLGPKSYPEFRAYARAAAGGTDYVSAGFGTMGNWIAEYLAAAEKIKLNHVAYKGGAQAMLDLLAGHVKVAMLTYASVSGHIRAGSLVPLAVTSADRMTALPEVPTLRELGLGDFTSLVWFSLSGPARMPMEIVEAINREANKAMQAPHIREQMARDAIEAKPMTPAEMTRFTQDEIDRWGPLIKRIMATKE